MNSSPKSLSLIEFKTVVSSVVKSFKQLKSSARSEAFDYLQDCVNSLEAIDEDARTTLCDNIENDNDGNLLNFTIDSKNTEVWNKDASDCEQSIENITDDNQLTCPNCRIEYTSRESLFDHLKSYPGDHVLCKFCNVSFENNFVYEYHLKFGFCKIEKLKKCPHCEKSFTGKSCYDRHVEGHKRNGCKECGAKFTQRKQLSNHMIEVHKTRLEDDLFRCELCPQGFKQRRSLVHHYKLVHSNETNVCSVCCMIFENLDELDKHSKTHVIKQYVCERCNQTFSRSQQYYIHTKAHDNFKCLTCDESFAAKSKVIEHERLGHVVEGTVEMIKCSKCNKSFVSKSNLKVHAATHLDEKKFFCADCKISFKKKSSYNRHFLSAAHAKDQPPTEEMLFCEDCGKMFTRKDKLIAHQSNVHKPSKKLHQCEYCSYKTKVEANLKKHVLLHTQKQQFICEICGSMFYCKNALKVHIKCVHSDEMSYNCERCGKMFKLMSSLNKHMLSHSDERTKVCHCGHAYKFVHNLRRHQLMAHGKVEGTKRLQRLFEEDKLIVQNKKKKKQDVQKQQETNDIDDPVLSLINTQTTSAPHETVLLMSDRQDTSQILQVSYHSINFSEKPHLVYAQSLDMSNLQVVETMLHLGQDSLKGNQNVIDESPAQHSGLYDRPMPEVGFLHPPIEPSLVTSLGETEESNAKQSLMSTLPDYIPHNFPFLNV